MKTQMNISNLKRMTITTCFALMITAGSFSSLRAESPASDYTASLIRLENHMNATENLIKYTVPEVLETEVVSAELEILENLFVSIESSLKYEVPAFDEADKIAPELAQLEMLANVTESLLRYEVPSADEVTEEAPGFQHLELMAAATEASLKYEAPAIIDNIENNSSEGETLNMMADNIK